MGEVRAHDLVHELSLKVEYVPCFLVIDRCP